MEDRLPIVSLMERSRGDERKGVKKRRMKEAKREGTDIEEEEEKRESFSEQSGARLLLA